MTEPSVAKPSEKNSVVDEKKVKKILKSGLALLSKVQEMDPNNRKYPYNAEMCEVEFRDVLLLDPKNVEAAVGLSDLFREHYNKNASQEAISILNKVLAYSPENIDLIDAKKSHEELIKRLS